MFTKTMHKISTIFALIIICSNSFALEFYSTNKTHTYNIERFSQQISEQHKNHFELYSILIAANNINNKTYKNQINELNKLNAESLSLAFVHATTDKENAHGYHTSSEEAKNVLLKNKFILSVYSPKGKKMLSSTTVVSASKIKNIIKEHNKAIKKDE